MFMSYNINAEIEKLEKQAVEYVQNMPEWADKYRTMRNAVLETEAAHRAIRAAFRRIDIAKDRLRHPDVP